MKKFQKLLTLLLTAAMTLSLAACGSTPDSAGNNSDESANNTLEDTGGTDLAANKEYKVAMITDYGDITDESFNQTT